MNKSIFSFLLFIASAPLLSQSILPTKEIDFNFRYPINIDNAVNSGKELKSNIGPYKESTSDYEFINQWSLQNIGQRVYTGRGIDGLDIGAMSAWNISEGVQNGVIAIIGSKVDLTHEDLQNAFWVNLEETPDNGVDDDGNGFIDDIKGVNVLEGNGNIHSSSISGLTPLVGIISAEKNNSIGIAGLTNNKILPCIIEDASSSATIPQLQQCFDHIKYLKHEKKINIHTILLPWGISANSKNDIKWFKDMLLEMLPLDINIVAPVRMAGTAPYDHLDSVPDYPASFNLPHVISVTASNKHSYFMENSGHGFHTVNLAAPGSEILTTVPGVMPKFTQDNSLFYDDFEGELEKWNSDSTVFSIVGETNKVLSINTVNSDGSKDEAELISIPVDLSGTQGRPLVISYKFKMGEEEGAPPPIYLEIGAGGFNGMYGLSLFSYQSENWRHYYRYLDPYAHYNDEQLKEATLEIKVTHLNSSAFEGEALIDDLAIGILADTGNSDKYEFYHGTSAAAAHVAGAISLIRGYKPNLIANEIKNILISSGTEILNWNYPDQNIPTDWVMGGNTLKIHDESEQSAMTCSNQTVTRRVFPTFDGVIAVKDSDYPLGILNINCEQPQGNVEVITNQNKYVLTDDGNGVDEFQNDGLYTTGINFNATGDFLVEIGSEHNPNLNVRVFDMYKEPVEVPYEWEEPEDGIYNDKAIFAHPPFPINIGNVIDIHKRKPLGFLVLSNGSVLINRVERSDLSNLDKLKHLHINPKQATPALPLNNDQGNILIAPLRQNFQEAEGFIADSILSFATGEQPNRKWVLEWRDMKQSGCTLPLQTYQLVFFESKGNIQFNYKKVSANECEGIIPTAGIQIGANHASIYSGELRDELSLKFETLSTISTNINQPPHLTARLPRTVTTQLSGYVINLPEYFSDENIDTVTFNLDNTRGDFLLDGVEIIGQELHINTRELLSTGILEIEAVDEQGLVSDIAYLSYSVQGEAPQIIKEFEELSLEVGQSHEVNLDNYFRDNLDSSLTYEVRELDSGFSLSEKILTLNFVSTGFREFLIIATDSDNLSSVLRAAVRVEELNNSPLSTNDTVTTEFETAININILSNDSDSDGDLDISTVSIESEASNGAVEVLFSGEVKYTPNNGFSGNDSFKYTVNDNDGATSNEAMVSITVKARSTGNNPPPNNGSSSGGGGSTSLLLMLIMLTFASRRYYR